MDVEVRFHVWIADFGERESALDFVHRVIILGSLFGFRLSFLFPCGVPEDAYILLPSGHVISLDSLFPWSLMSVLLRPPAGAGVAC